MVGEVGWGCESGFVVKGRDALTCGIDDRSVHELPLALPTKVRRPVTKPSSER